ncbi:hypothetical protein J31TS4_21520 [Paenibacillus sp. J31TS4]|nr:hypothetical protein J31TS4_21520 [Paenibacillus sp. J31TS4]
MARRPGKEEGDEAVLPELGQHFAFEGRLTNRSGRGCAGCTTAPSGKLWYNHSELPFLFYVILQILS